MIVPADVEEGLGGELVSSSVPPNTGFGRAAIDSRDVKPADLFFALHGENHDGHDFLPAVFAGGASGAVVDRPLTLREGLAGFHVSNTQTALQRLSAYWRRRSTARVIGVTGSVGKTTAKEVIAGVLSTRYTTLKSEGNLNTEIGLPLSLLRLEPEHECAVLEMGMYVPGDVRLLARLSRPHVGVVMNVGPVHMERAGSIGRIAAGKAELVENLPADGLAVLNGDDPRVAAMRRVAHCQTRSFGVSEACDVRASDVESHGLNGFSFTMHTPGNEPIAVECPLPGKHHVYPALAAAAVALHVEFQPGEIADALRTVRVDLRLRVRRGLSGSVIIDDSYNASPASMLAALDLLAEMPGRRIAVLGHMRELGAAEEEWHRQVGSYAMGRCDQLIVAGSDGKALAESALLAGHTDVRCLQDPEELVAELRRELRAGDHVLIKASRAVGLEDVVSEVVEE